MCIALCNRFFFVNSFPSVFLVCGRVIAVAMAFKMKMKTGKKSTVRVSLSIIAVFCK